MDKMADRLQDVVTGLAIAVTILTLTAGLYYGLNKELERRAEFPPETHGVR